MDLITKDSNTTQVLFSSLDRVLENMEYMMTNYRPVLGGEHYLTGEEVCQKLCISKRTLQDVNSTLAVSNIRNRTYTNCEVYLIDYGYGNFKEKIHFME